MSVAMKSVLYAEDDENDVFFMERAFSKLKLRSSLHIVPNGRAAIDYLSGTGAFADRGRHPPPELLLLDVKIPEMSGLEVLQWVREQTAFHGLPIVMFTSSTQQTDIEFCRENRASAYFVKPSNAENLPMLVDKILTACRTRTSEGAAVLALDGNLLRPPTA